MATNGNRREAAALALASGRTIKAAAKETKVGERTLHRWLKTDPSFRQRVTDYRDEFVSQTVGRLSALSVKATDTVAGLLDSEDEKVQIQAVRLVYESLAATREAVEFAARLNAVEQWREREVPDETTESEVEDPAGAGGEGGDAGPGAAGSPPGDAAAG